MTALAAASNLIFAGSGPDLKIYRDDESAEELGSIRVFESQALHGIVVGVCSHGSLPVLIWGGRCVRALRIAVGPNAGSWGFSIGDVKLSNVIQLVDWILSAVIEPRLTDLSDAWDGASPTAVVITAHNSLILIRHGARLTVQSPLAKSSLEIESCQVTPGSRTILYSAFLLWPTASRTIAACGTAFGELLIWSYEWNLTGGQEITHHVFQAHEGSVFGVHISNRVVLAPGEPGVRFLASCSDDRTIRVWDIGNVDEEEPGSTTLADVYGMAARQTGFQTPQRSNTGIPQKLTHLAMTMGHDSRIWSVSFIDDAGLKDTHSKSARLVSCGEDGTCRLWDLVAQRERVSEDTRVTYDIRNSEKLLNHSGKNIWSSALSTKQCGNVGSIITGGADGAIISAVLPPHQVLGHGQHSFPETSSWSLSEVYTVAGNLREVEVPDKRDCFRSYAFLNDDQLLVTTNSGAVLVSRPHTDGLRKWTCLAVIAELKGYSTVTNGEGSSLAFIAGGKGHVYAVDAVAGTTTQLIVFEHKVATVFVLDVEDPKSGQDGQPGEDSIRLLITFIAGQAPCLMVVQRRYGSKPSLLQQVALSSDDVGISGHVITSAFLIKNYHHNILFLGTRNGTILALGVSVQPGDALYGKANLLSLVDQIHGQESVTGLRWLHGDDDQASLGYLFSVGRDGALAVHVVVMPSSGEATLTLVHKLVLPFGPNIEGLLINGPADELLVYGFHSTKFILYNVNMMREITTINCGGAHRNWALSAYRSKQFGKIQCGLFAWTQAGVLNIYSSTAPASRSIRSGGHGRDIKACAIAANPLKRSSKNIMIATGAEDTNIGLFHYESNVKGGMFRCVAVLRKHLTGIQSLKWSSDNSYLFSSGGFEEFFIWKVRPVPCLGVGIVLESACPVEDAGSEQRITAFAVAEIDHPVGDGLKKAFVISMVYSNSSIKVSATAQSRIYLKVS